MNSDNITDVRSVKIHEYSKASATFTEIVKGFIVTIITVLVYTIIIADSH